MGGEGGGATAGGAIAPCARAALAIGWSTHACAGAGADPAGEGKAAGGDRAAAAGSGSATGAMMTEGTAIAGGAAMAAGAATAVGIGAAPMLETGAGAGCIAGGCGTAAGMKEFEMGGG